MAKAKDFLESNTYSAEDPYTTALSAYALALLRSPYAPLALRRLNHMAITQGTATHAVASSELLDGSRVRALLTRGPDVLPGARERVPCADV